MATLPEGRKARVEYFEQHLPVWQDNAGAVGLTVAQLTSLSTFITAARTTLNAAEAARSTSKSATVAFYNAEEPMTDLGADLIKTIRAFAETTNNPNVYATAQIPPPAAPTPTPPPEQPDDLSGLIDPFGVITLAWKAVPKGPTSGVFFFVERKIGAGTWTPIGATQESTFADPAAGQQAAAATVAYRVQARRGAEASAWSDPLNVSFGGGQDGIAGFIGDEGGEGLAEAA
ncbi:MAG: hypothetical protein ACKVU4_10355 [Phycisphaerales bacterium]